MLTHISGAADHERNRERFVSTIANAHVVWVLIPVQASETGEPRGIHLKDLTLTKGYLREAIRKRKPGVPVSIAFLITKADILGETSQSALESMQSASECVAQSFGPLLDHSKEVLLSAIFPVSSLGFGNAYLRADTSEPQWSLQSGMDFKPWNVDKLLLWSLTCGLTHQDRMQPNNGHFQSLAKRLSTDAESLPGWVRPLKTYY